MADLPDVLIALGNLSNGALYPSGQPMGSVQASPVAGVPVRIMDGWPTPAALDGLKTSTLVVVSIYPLPTERKTTRYPRMWETSGSAQAQTFTLTQIGQTVAVGGQQPTSFYGQNFAVFVNGKAYIYRSLLSDGINSIASALCALISADVGGVSVAANVITFPSTARIGPLRMGTQAPIAQEVKRQEREFQITIWSGNPDARNKVASPIDIAIAQNAFLAFADGSKGRLLYKNSPFTDFDQKAGLFRRDLIVTVEYPTLASDMAPQATVVETIISQEAPDGATITPPIRTTYT